MLKGELMRTQKLKPEIVHRGTLFHRTQIEDEQGRLERELASYWEKMNKPRRGQGVDPILPSLLNPTAIVGGNMGMCSNVGTQLGEMTERDAMVAATIFQWCGTHVGRASLSGAFEKAGFKLTFEKMEGKK